ncbi:RagB/SusD family nutrient uptake outer membrane protein [Belliella marina]|uniref:RagB/SusD family nutrient uptake outer membrane protein n=1 Tax=Belliella marina TaxID=1644146 RepID=A0ABW4VVC8_9BACT
MNKIYRLIILMAITGTFTRCDSYFDPITNDILDNKDYIGNTNELYSGYMGIAAKMQVVADQAIFLTELKSDFLEPTPNAPQELWDIYNLNDLNGNAYANPKGYYDVIINANDYIAKALEYRDGNPRAVDNAVFVPLISGAIRFKVWAYLMLGKIYGEAVYFDAPLATLTDLSKFPVLSLDELIPKLMELMDVGTAGIDGKQVLIWTNLLFPGVATSAQDLTWNMICPSPEPLLIELNLWGGNYQRVVDMSMQLIYDNGGGRYKIGNDDYNAEWVQFFHRDPITKTRELINIVPFDYERNQTNRLIRYFSNTHPSVHYVKPTEVSMSRFERQVRLDGITIGDNFRGNNYTYMMQNGDWVVRKFSRDRESSEMIYRNNVHIVIYRAAEIHLFLAEALNNLGHFAEAEAFLNDGVQEYLSKYAGNLKYPLDNEVYNSVINRNWGVRRRVNLQPVYPEGLSKENLETNDDIQTYKRRLDELILEEYCMETAGEAKSYFAMIRIAKRWNAPSILADRVSAKYSPGMQSNVRNTLMDQNNWFVKYDLSLTNE